MKIRKMNHCIDCSLDDITQYCCIKHPETDEVKEMEVKNHIRLVCPNLAEDGGCMAYDDKPDICKLYYCHKFYEEGD